VFDLKTLKGSRFSVDKQNDKQIDKCNAPFSSWPWRQLAAQLHTTCLVACKRSFQADSDEVDEKAFNCCVAEDELTTSLRDDINRMFKYDFLLRPGEETRSEMKHPSIQDEFALKQIDRYEIQIGDPWS
jgi:hypothetical protein